MKLISDLRNTRNPWDYYFVKWGFKKEAILELKTLSEPIFIKINKDEIIYKKGLYKAIFNLIRENRVIYNKERNKMIVYDKDKIKSKEFDLDIFALEVIKELMDYGINFYQYDRDFFITEINQYTKFFIRKHFVSDWQVLVQNFIYNQYDFLYRFLKDSYVLDIGAYIGDTAILFCKKGAKKVYAFEPHPLLFEICKKNIELNNLEKKYRIF